jgi:hypothetical protein
MKNYYTLKINKLIVTINTDIATVVILAKGWVDRE